MRQRVALMGAVPSLRMGRRASSGRCGLLILLLSALLVGCGGASPAPSTGVSQGALEPVQLGPGEKLQVLASTSLVGDIVREIGGEMIKLEVLLPLGTDPHGYAPTPHDLRRVHQADVMFVNGLGLEGQLLAELQTAAPDTPVVSLSEGVEPLSLRHDGQHEYQDVEDTHDHGGEGEGQTDHKHDESEGAHEDPGADPHVWFDPLNVKDWAANTAQALGALDPENAEAYRSSADAYARELDELDGWIRERVGLIPERDRRLVTEHLVFGYFAERYGFEMVGAVVPGYSSVAEPSAQALAELERLIESRGVKAIFVSVSGGSALAEQVAADLDITLVGLYIESLSDAAGPAATYVDFMRFNVERIVAALADAPGEDAAD